MSYLEQQKKVEAEDQENERRRLENEHEIENERRRHSKNIIELSISFNQQEEINGKKTTNPEIESSNADILT